MQASIGRMKASSNAVGNEGLEFEIADITYASSTAICGHKVNGDYFSCNPEFWVFVSSKDKKNETL